MKYSDTLNLPKTDFPMRAELSRREPEIERLWDEMDIYRRSLEKPAPNGDFVLHDGPPYSNGHLHMGHALDHTLMDALTRRKRMQGFEVLQAELAAQVRSGQVSAVEGTARILDAFAADLRH